VPLLYVLGALASLVAAWRAWRRLRYFLHVFQLEGYKPNEFAAWLAGRGRSKLLAPSHGAGLALLLLGGLLTLRVPLAGGLLAGLGWLVAFASDARWASAREKKPLAFTDRMRRLTAAALALAALPVLAGAGGLAALDGAPGVLALLGGWYLADLGAPLWVRLAAALMAPVERASQEGFKKRAMNQLAARPDLTVVAITGSYGKTSVKFAVAEVLRQRFNTLATPGSFNTPMGISKVVNDQLRDDHRVVVLEMGARYSHDIRELTAMVRPDVAVVTSVGVAHLETMGPVENIQRVKGDLVAALKPGGQAVLNADDPRVAAMTDRLPADAGRVWTVSAKGTPGADVAASAITYGPDGARFTVRDDTGEEEPVATRLLGEHNVLNVLLAVAVGRAMGLRLRQIARAVERIEPVPHRLALRKEGGVTVIDDAFNANPVGARNAVEILGRMPVPDGGRRAVVTPGMVELGERQAEENRAFGEAIARSLPGARDLAVLVGPRQTAPIREGLAAAGFPEARVRVVRSLFEARDVLREELRDGDVVLYENDLPDQYAE
jgi:UDP-N-acetylmuramoyl-tripeptide--D-alanyl-D-alanine ligase